jgi:hypothetical protein
MPAQAAHAGRVAIREVFSMATLSMQHNGMPSTPRSRWHQSSSRNRPAHGRYGSWCEGASSIVCCRQLQPSHCITDTTQLHVVDRRTCQPTLSSAGFHHTVWHCMPAVRVTCNDWGQVCCRPCEVRRQQLDAWLHRLLTSKQNMIAEMIKPHAPMVCSPRLLI